MSTIQRSEDYQKVQQRKIGSQIHEGVSPTTHKPHKNYQNSYRTLKIQYLTLKQAYIKCKQDKKKLEVQRQAFVHEIEFKKKIQTKFADYFKKVYKAYCAGESTNQIESIHTQNQFQCIISSPLLLDFHELLCQMHTQANKQKNDNYNLQKQLADKTKNEVILVDESNIEDADEKDPSNSEHQYTPSQLEQQNKKLKDELRQCIVRFHKLLSIQSTNESNSN